MKFEQYNLDEKVLRGLNTLGFKRPTDIQYKSIPSILNGEDLLAIAQTGTGKTLAFVLPIVEILFNKKRKERRKGGIKCIILAPTHELALQINEVFQKIAKHTSLKSYVIIGGVDQDPQIEALNKGIDVAIATPGRMFDLISQGHLRTNDVETLVLDEADHMLNLGFIDDIRDLIRVLPKRKQTLFFSATINKKIKKIAYSIVKQNAIRIQISPKNPVSKNVKHYVVRIDMDDKRFFLERLVFENPESKIICFVRTKVRAERVHQAMLRVNIESATIHSDKDQDEREDSLSSFRAGKTNLLVATDITARGIDIPDVQIVVNYDLPDEPENYVHRIGRTGRGNNKGMAYSFCAPKEQELLQEIEKFIDNKIEVIKVDRKTYSDTLNIKVEKDNDVQALMQEFEESKKLKRKKRK